MTQRIKRPLHAVATWIAVMLTLRAAPALCQTPGLNVTSSSSSSWPVSPSTIASVLISNQRIGLIVLWRGESRWYIGGNGNRSRSESRNNVVIGSFTMGGREMGYSYDFVRRVAMIELTELRLEAGEDVILVSDVDRPTGPKVAGRIKANLSARGPDDIAAALQSSGDAMAFMQCDLPSRDAGFNGGSGCGSLPAAPLASAMRSPDLSGAWNIELNPDFSGNQDTLQCTFTQDGNKLSIRCGDQFMSGEVNGPLALWRFTTGPNGSMTAMFSGPIDSRAQRIAGTWRLTGGGPSRTGRFTATKVP